MVVAGSVQLAPTALTRLGVFRSVCAELPGELAPILAVAVSAEIAETRPPPKSRYQAVATTDASYVTASFGLARTLRRKGDRLGAVEALERVPSNSSAYQSARVASFSYLVEIRSTALPGARTWWRLPRPR